MKAHEGPKVHDGQPIHRAGRSLEQAEGAMILLHGKGAHADNIVELSELLACERISYIAPQAADGMWFPRGVIDPIWRNEPHFSASLGLVDEIVSDLESHGIRRENMVFTGFCQGACLALEYVLQRPKRYGGVFALSGALLGKDERVHTHRGDLKRTPVFFGSSDIDFMVPRTRLLSSAELFRELNADVRERLYPGMPHTINEEEVDLIRDALHQLFDPDW